jgi:AcrR family transcriptional regulator
VSDDESLGAGETTRVRLMEAGMEVMARRGYHATRIDDVAKLAGVSHGTFYLYFANKDDLMLTLAERCATELGELTAQLGAISEGPSGRKEVRRWLTDFLALYRAYGVVIRSWVENQSSDPQLTRLGIEYLGVVSGTLIDRLATVHPEDAGLRVAALISLIERFTYLVVTRDLGDEAEVLDTAATIIHRSFFAAAPSER